MADDTPSPLNNVITIDDERIKSPPRPGGAGLRLWLRAFFAKSRRAHSEVWPVLTDCGAPRRLSQQRSLYWPTKQGRCGWQYAAPGIS